MIGFGLSKSRIMNGRQCPKLLWVQVHEPERIVHPPSLQRIFAMGHAVGAVAQAQHPDGVLVGGPDRGTSGRPDRGTSGRPDRGASGRPDLRAALRETGDLLARRGDLTLFEATFEHDGILVRTDLLFRERRRVRFTEVKSSTSVKEEHIPDAAIQAWVLQESGVPVDGVRIGHVDNTFVYQGDGDYTGLLVEEDVTGAVAARVPEVSGWVADLRRMLAGGMPGVFVGRQCTTPHTCPLYDWCRECDGEVHVGYLPGSNALVEQLQSEGYVRLRDVPTGRITGRDQARVWEATVAGRAQLDPAIRDVLAALPYPRYYFDFETINFAVPIWAGTRPWEQVPFQFSCHVDHGRGHIEHREFLDLSGESPLRACAEAVLEALDERPAAGPVPQAGSADRGTAGPGRCAGGAPVLAYWAGFERGVLQRLQGHFPDLADGLQGVIDRLVDLHPIVKQHYYHPAMYGSWSLKAVLPTVVAELAYDDLDGVHEGTEAQLAYEEAIDPATSAERREQIRRDLLAYCERDTLAMVELVRYFASV